MPAQNYSWQQTMLRIKDPKASLPFYEKNFGMKLVNKYDFPQFKFTVYFLGAFPQGTVLPEVGTDAANDFTWTTKFTLLELTHNWGTENQPDFKHNSGNEEPSRGFGHIAFHTNDVYAACTELEAAGASFKKKPDEGRMKGLAFVYDPDGYWIELIKRPEGHNIDIKYNLSQTMLRIKDPKKSVPFYTKNFGMTVVNERHFADAKFSLYFLAVLPEGVSAPADVTSVEAGKFTNALFNPILELTHNHGTEDDTEFAYHNGNDAPQGFGHTGFLANDLDSACDELEAAGVVFKKKPADGKMRNLAFVVDPDNYYIEVIQRGAKSF